MKALLTLFVLLICAGCDGSSVHWWDYFPGYRGYWWQRGQPKSVLHLLEGSQIKLATSLTNFSSARPDIAPNVEAIQSSLTGAYQQVLAGAGPGQVSLQLGKTEETFIDLEMKLSIGSRAAYGELAGQLRMFSEKLRSGQDIKDEGFRESFGLYTSRVLSFLANELSVPAPV